MALAYSYLIGVDVPLILQTLLIFTIQYRMTFHHTNNSMLFTAKPGLLVSQKLRRDCGSSVLGP